MPDVSKRNACSPPKKRWTNIIDGDRKSCLPYVPPAPFTYDPGVGCFREIARYYSIGPKPPTFEEFQQFGAALAYGELFYSRGTGCGGKNGRGYRHCHRLGVVSHCRQNVGATIGFSITFGTLGAVLPYAGLTFSIAGGIATPVFPAAASASGAIGATAVGVPLAIITVAVTIFVIQLINVINQSQLPGKLQEALNSAQNQTINPHDLTMNDDGRKELYGAFILATLPDFLHTTVPAPDPHDRQFVVSQNGTGGTIDRSTISYKDLTGVCHTVRLSGAWFVDGHQRGRKTDSFDRISGLGFSGENSFQKKWAIFSQSHWMI